MLTNLVLFFQGCRVTLRIGSSRYDWHASRNIQHHSNSCNYL